MMQKTVRLILITSLFLCMIMPVAASADASSSAVLTGVTTGQMKIYKQDIQGAKRNAVEQALERAVQNAFASLVSHQVFASNLEFLYDRLLPGADEYVITYRVLSEMQLKGSVLVGVESKIDLAKVQKRLEEARIIRTGMEKPVILLLIAEQAPGDLLPRYWWGNNPEPYSSLAEAMIKKEMALNQIPLAQTGTTYPDPGFYTIHFQGIYDTRAAMDLGLALKADMVIMGKASAKESFNRMGDAKTFDAVIDLKGLDLASGKEVIQVQKEAAASSDVAAEGAVLALNKAAQEAAQDLIAKVESFWNQTLRRESHFDVAVEGENFLPRFIALKRRLKDIREIVNMQPKEVGSSSAVLEILYKGSPEQFANTVLLKTFAGFGLEIAEVSPELVSIRFVEKESAPSGADPETPEKKSLIENPVQ